MEDFAYWQYPWDAYNYLNTCRENCLIDETIWIKNSHLFGANNLLWNDDQVKSSIAILAQDDPSVFKVITAYNKFGWTIANDGKVLYCQTIIYPDPVGFPEEILLKNWGESTNSKVRPILQNVYWQQTKEHAAQEHSRIVSMLKEWGEIGFFKARIKKLDEEIKELQEEREGCQYELKRWSKF